MKSVLTLNILQHQEEFENVSNALSVGIVVLLGQKLLILSGTIKLQSVGHVTLNEGKGSIVACVISFGSVKREDSHELNRG